ncbi:hypothetical protein KGP36_01970 [Patescibacteria group bacterium]|nr:hypothetical protein [Patescibacteria group bacterium]
MKKLFILLAIVFLPSLVHAQEWQRADQAPSGPGWVWSSNDITTTTPDTILVYTVPSGRTLAGFSWYFQVTDTAGGTKTTDTIELGTSGGSYVDYDAKTTIDASDAGSHSVWGPQASNSMGLSGSPRTPVYSVAGTKIYAVSWGAAGWKVHIVFVGILL